MNVKRFLGLALLTYLACAACAVIGQKDTPPPVYLSTPATITLGDLSPQQLQDRAEELTTTTSTTSSTSTTSTQPTTTVVPEAMTYRCAEWFPIAISVGWPNNTEILAGLSHLLWKETRCQNINYTHPRFNGHDHGLVQANEVHRRWAEELFNMPFEESMSDPTLNLRFGWLLYESVEETGGCGFHPWGMC